MSFPRQTSEGISSTGLPASSTPISSAAGAVESGSEGRAASDADSASAPSNSDSPNSISGSSASASAAPSPSSSASAHSNSSDASSSQSVSKSAPPPSSSSSASSTPPSSSSAGPSSSSSTTSASSTTTTTTTTSAFVSLADSATTTASAPGLSTSFTTIVTSTDGHATTIISPLPTSLSTAASSTSTARRTAIIAGATAAGVGVVLLLLGSLFVYKRHKGRKLEFSEAIGRVRREAHGAGGVGLLDEEGFDDDDGVPMRRYRDNAGGGSRSMNMSQSSLGPPQSPAPSLFRQRAETGSLFREEGVWPPPQGNHFVDPLVGVGTGEGLGRIVDDIMGPASHLKDGSASSTAHALPAVLTDPNPRGNIPSMSSASSSLYADPFRDSSHAALPSDPSLYYDRRGASSSMSSNSHSTSRPTTPQSLLGLPAGAAQTPKKPSPLANANPPSSATWLNRSPRKHGQSGSQSSTEG
ncbi:hypothetical protein FB451DRAFT_233316 [Mycena latifolia]|nr:hypothetical protein FB451DRAFT_233316 [Mycena latifolia]